MECCGLIIIIRLVMVVETLHVSSLQYDTIYGKSDTRQTKKMQRNGKYNGAKNRKESKSHICFKTPALRLRLVTYFKLQTPPALSPFTFYLAPFPFLLLPFTSLLFPFSFSLFPFTSHFLPTPIISYLCILIR